MIRTSVKRKNYGLERFRSTVAAGISTGWADTYSVTFDGVDEFVNTGYNVDLSGGGAFSVFHWYKGLVPGSHYLVSQAHQLVPSYASDWILGYSNGGLWFRSTTIDGANLVYDGLWHLHGFTFDGTTARLYVDDNPQGIPTTPVGFGAVSDVKLMTRGDATSAFETGLQDEVSIWRNVDLSPAQVVELYNGGTPYNLVNHSAYLNLDAWWRMGDGDVFPVLSDNKGSFDATMVNMEPGDIITDVP